MSEADRDAYLARVRARLVAARDGGHFVESAVAAPVPPPPPVVSAQPSAYSESARGDDLRVELAGVATALTGVAGRLAEVARSIAAVR